MSQNSPHPCLLLSTCPDSPSAEALARRLLEQRLAACVSLLPGVQSFYHWQGAIQQGTEVLLLIKSDSRHYPAIEALLLRHHPYEVPELLQFPIQSGLPAYLTWLLRELRLEN